MLWAAATAAAQSAQSPDGSRGRTPYDRNISSLTQDPNPGGWKVSQSAVASRPFRPHVGQATSHRDSLGNRSSSDCRSSLLWLIPRTVLVGYSRSSNRRGSRLGYRTYIVRPDVALDHSQLVEATHFDLD